MITRPLFALASNRCPRPRPAFLDMDLIRRPVVFYQRRSSRSSGGASIKPCPPSRINSEGLMPSSRAFLSSCSFCYIDLRVHGCRTSTSNYESLSAGPFRRYPASSIQSYVPESFQRDKLTSPDRLAAKAFDSTNGRLNKDHRTETGTFSSHH